MMENMADRDQQPDEAFPRPREMPEVTPETMALYRGVRTAILQNMEKLKAMSRRYPVMIDVADQRFILIGEGSADVLATDIDLAIAAALGRYWYS
jgi:hypothetical protein